MAAPEGGLHVRLERLTSSSVLSLNMTSFIDMMFILVLFFLVTSRFQEEERDERIRLASTRSTLPISTLSDTLIINVDRDGRRLVDGKQRTLEEVEEIVRARKSQREATDVVIRADVRALVGSLQEVTEICHRLGIKTPHVAYENTGGR
jgi:biopolymer transport protein ExbD